jgi:hypothetical protein
MEMVKQLAKIRVTVDSFYHRVQFDDWLAGGEVEYKGRTYYWSAQDGNYGFGWEIEAVTEEDWSDIPKDKSDEIITLIEKCLCRHRTEYVF